MTLTLLSHSVLNETRVEKVNKSYKPCLSANGRTQETPVNLRNRTGNERRRQILCHECENNFA